MIIYMKGSSTWSFHGHSEVIVLWFKFIEKKKIHGISEKNWNKESWVWVGIPRMVHGKTPRKWHLGVGGVVSGWRFIGWGVCWMVAEILSLWVQGGSRDPSLMFPSWYLSENDRVSNYQLGWPLTCHEMVWLGPEY